MMVRLPSEKIRYLLNLKPSRYKTTEKGRALEEAVYLIFREIPGVSLKDRNRFGITNNQELDLAFWNKKCDDGLYFMDNIIPIECKNWERTVSGQQISWFIQKLKKRNLRYGILVARNGIAGDDGKTKGAYTVITDALAEGISIVVLRKEEIENLTGTSQIVELLEKKFCSLMISVKVN